MPTASLLVILCSYVPCDISSDRQELPITVTGLWVAERDVTITLVKQCSEDIIFCDVSQLVTKDQPVYLVTSTQGRKVMNMEIRQRHSLPLFSLSLPPALVEGIAEDISELIHKSFPLLCTYQRPPENDFLVSSPEPSAFISSFLGF